MHLKNRLMMANLFQSLRRCRAFVACIGIIISLGLNAQTIWTNPITGTNINASPYTTGQTVASNITVSGISRGAGITGENETDTYSASGWNGTSFATASSNNDYFEFTLTPSTLYKITFGSFTYSASVAGANAPTSFSFRSSLDNYATDLGTATSTGTTIDLSTLAEVKDPSSVTFRLYAWNANNSNPNRFKINDFTFTGAIALPIELLSFSHTVEQSQITLNWSTAIEKDNDYMAIERSFNGQNFSEIGRVKGAGNSLERIDYRFVDLFPYKGTNYYRLRQVDFGGKTTFHKVIAAEFNGESTNTFRFTSNTAQNEVQVQFRAPGPGGQLVLVDVTGKMLKITKFEAQALSANISTLELSRGFYVVQLRRLDGQHQSWSFIK